MILDLDGLIRNGSPVVGGVWLRAIDEASRT